MSSSVPEIDARAVKVEVTDEKLIVDLADGRTVVVPLAWFPRLLHATPEQRAKCELLGDGHGMHRPDIDEDLSVAGLLRGTRAPSASSGLTSE